MTEPDVHDLIGVADAIRILDAEPVVPRVVEVALPDAAGLRLAADVAADRDAPPFDKAVMDGYAVRSADVATAGTTLAVVDTVAAGGVGRRPVGPGEAVAIMTGAPMPPGADAVVPVETTTRRGDRVGVAAARPGQFVARLGSDVTAGTVVLPTGTRLGPAQLAAAAAVGAARVAVYARPTVAVLCTGDELVDVGQVPAGPQIRNSNGPMMLALLARLGCDVRPLGIVADDVERTRAALADGLTADALCVTGGMSMGDRDHVPRLLVELGLTPRISKLRIKPGKPFVFAVGGRGLGTGDWGLGEERPSSSSPGPRPQSLVPNLRSPVPIPRFAFGLPGNPVSAFVCTVRLAARVLSRMAGGPADADLVRADLSVPLPANGPREFYQPATWDGRSVTPLPWKGSADLFTLARANALLIRPESAPAAAAGDAAEVIALDAAVGDRPAR